MRRLPPSPFLECPLRCVPANAMPYPGVKDAATCHAIADYLQTLK